MGKNTLIIGAVVLAALGGLTWFLMGSSSQPVTTPEVVQTQNQATPSTQATDSGEQAGVKEFTVTGSGYKFNPPTLTVNKGDKVKITFKNSGGIHDFVIDEFGVKTKQLKAGEQEVVEFTTEKAGRFEYYCSVADHKAMGMVGTLVVQ